MISTTPTIASLLRQLKPSQLRLIAALNETSGLGQSADRIGISQPAASRLLAEMEGLLGLQLHERQGRGLRLTPAGAALARRAARIQIELADAAREVAEAASGNAGTVRVGAVTGPALSLVMPAILTLQEKHPAIQIEVTVATSVVLCDQLREGSLDFALARPGATDALLEARLIGDEPLSVAVRRGHPLLQRPGVGMADLLDYDWILGPDDTLLTQTVMARLAELRLPVPRRPISTSSFLFTLAVLNQSDAIAPLALPVVQSFSGNPSMPFVALPVNLGVSVTPFSMVTRIGSRLTPAAQRLADAITALAENPPSAVVS
ncbi:MAG: LysR family transcriptional regulator [Rhodobacteraceae bacterium]|jgi:DNA-binding transcriptional LysR family regulator|nr:LysR family transcriptional regulator [Paracoccaceae bacterium]